MAKLVVTGVAGCIGSWIAKHLIEDGHEVVGVDIATGLPMGELLGLNDAFPLRRLDVTDSEAYRDLLAEERPDGVIHLASLLMPRCKADPLLCVDLNVKSLQTVLEAAREQGFNVAYASSAWVLDAPADDRLLTEDDPVSPQSLYGVFKLTNEWMSKTYARDFGVASNGLRPYIVYGPGREAGLTADVNLALLSAAAGKPYRIGFGGTVALHHASDVARLFIALAVSPVDKGRVYNVRGSVVPMPEVVRTIEHVTGRAGLIEFDPTPLPIAGNLSDAALQRDYGPVEYLELAEGMKRTLEVYQRR